jgi:hypothetical protein
MLWQLNPNLRELFEVTLALERQRVDGYDREGASLPKFLGE